MRNKQFRYLRLLSLIIIHIILSNYLILKSNNKTESIIIFLLAFIIWVHLLLVLPNERLHHFFISF